MRFTKAGRSFCDDSMGWYDIPRAVKQQQKLAA